MFCRGMAGRLERLAHEVHGGVVFVCLGCVLGHPDGVGLGHTKSGRRTDGGGCSCQRKCQVALLPWSQQHGTIHEQDFYV